MPEPRTDRDAQQAEQLARHWRQRALEFRRLARGPERSMYRRAAEQARMIAQSFSRACGRAEIGARRAFGNDLI